MILTSEKIEKTFLPLLQHYIKFVCNGKKIKEGKLLLVSQKSSYICFTLLDTKNKTKVYEIPYPFKHTYCTKKNCVLLDYTLETLCNDNTETLQCVNNIVGDKSNRLMNTNIVISCVDIIVSSH